MTLIADAILDNIIAGIHRNRTRRGIETRGGAQTTSPKPKGEKPAPTTSTKGDEDRTPRQGDEDQESAFEGSFVQQLMEGGGDGRLGEDLMDVENLADEDVLLAPDGLGEDLMDIENLADEDDLLAQTPPPQPDMNALQSDSDDEGPIFTLHVLLTILIFSVESQSDAEDNGDTGKVRLCSDILDTLWHRAEVSINQVCEVLFESIIFLSI